MPSGTGDQEESSAPRDTLGFRPNNLSAFPAPVSRPFYRNYLSLDLSTSGLCNIYWSINFPLSQRNKLCSVIWMSGVVCGVGEEGISILERRLWVLGEILWWG